MKTILALYVACKVIYTPKNFWAGVIRTLKRCLSPSEMFGSKMPCQAINTPWLFPLALSYLVVGPPAERTEWRRTLRALHGELFRQRLLCLYPPTSHMRAARALSPLAEPSHRLYEAHTQWIDRLSSEHVCGL